MFHKRVSSQCGAPELVRMLKKESGEHCMIKKIVFCGAKDFTYFLSDLFTGEFYEVSDSEFFEIVGTDRDFIPMRYAEDNINRQNFFFNGELIAYRERFA